MAKRKIKSKDVQLPQMKEPDYSFSAEAGILLAGTVYRIREAIIEAAVKKARVKKCIARSVVQETIKQLKLAQYLGNPND